MGVTLVEKRTAAIAAGAGCHVAGQSLDDFGGQRRPEGVCDPGRLESAPSGAKRLMASLLGGTAQGVRPSGAGRVASDRAGGSRIVRSVAVGRHCGVGLASVLTDQCRVQSTLARRGEL